MKRIICLILAMILCLAVFTSCAQIEDILGNLGFGGDVTDEGVDKAHTFLSEMYKDLGGTHVEDFDVVAQVVIGGVKYPVAWAADSDKVTIRESVKFGYYTVDLPSDNEEEFSFTLTATISSLSSKATKDKSFTIKVPAATAEGVLSIPAALELGKAQANSSYTTEKYYVTGTVASISNETYGNLYIKDEDGNEILVYGTYDATGKIRFDKMTTKPAVGDVITIFGVVGNYNGAPQIKNGWLVALNGEQLGSGDNGGNTSGIVLDMMGSTNVSSYSTTQLIYAANGITLTNDKGSSSTDCYNNTGSYAARFYGGATIKIEYKGMTKIVITLDDYSPDGKKTYLAGLDGMTVEGATIVRDHDVVTIYFAAATDVFQSAALGSQIRVEQIEVFTGAVETPPTGGEGGTDTPDVKYDAPVANQAYKLYLVQNTHKKTLYFAGSLDTEKGVYLATTEDYAASVDIFFENVQGGYHIYFMNDNEKTYINAAAYLKDNGYAGCHFELGSEPICVWTYDTTYGILEIYDEIEGKSDTFFAGTYGSYSTISLSGSYYKNDIPSGTQFPARIVISDGNAPEQGGDNEGGNTDTPVNPEPTLTGKDLLDAAYALADGESLTGPFTLTGVISELDSWNNPTMVVGEYTDQPIYCFKLKDDRFVVGATITVTADSIKNYDGTIEMMNCTLDSITLPEGGDNEGNEGEEGGEGNEPETSSDIKLTIDNLGVASQSYAAGTPTINGVAFEFIQIGNYGNGIQMRDKDGNTSSLWNTSAFPGGIKEIQLVYSSTKDISHSNSDAVIFTFGNEAKGATYSTKLSTVSGTKTYTITPDAQTYTYFYLEHDLGYTFYWESITIVLADGSVVTPPTGEEGEEGGEVTPSTHEHKYVDGKCECGAEDPNYVAPEAPASGTVSVAIADYAAANGWTDATKYSSLTMNNYITVTLSGSGNTGKFYTNGNNWRAYQTESPSIVVDAADGKTIKSVKITYAISNSGVMTLNGEQIASGTVVEVNANSISFGVAQSTATDKANGQVRITSIEVIYE